MSAAAGYDPYTLPAGMPPPGVKPNFDAKAENAVTYYVIAGFLLCAMFAFMLLRTYTKLFLMRKFQLQDLTITLGFLGATYYFIVGVLFLTLAGGDKHVWDVRLSTIATDRFVIISWLSDAWPTLIFWWIRVSFFLLFLELFYPFKWVRILSWVSLAVMTGFYVPYFIVQMYWTSPKHGESWPETFTDPLFIKSETLAIPLASVGLFFDLFIFSVPLIAVQQLQMSKKTKLEVSLVFSTALIAIIASTVNIVYRVKSQYTPEDYTYVGFPAIFCSFVEMAVGVIVFCMPSVAHILHHRQRSRASTGPSTSKKNLVGGAGAGGTSWGSGSGNRTTRDKMATKKSASSSTNSRPSSVDGRRGVQDHAIRRDVEYGVSIELSDVKPNNNHNPDHWK